jgi:hypothetical protein
LCDLLHDGQVFLHVAEKNSTHRFLLA